VNAAQGPVVDEVALAQALKDGEIFAAEYNSKLTVVLARSS